MASGQVETHVPTTRTMFCRASLPVLAALTVIGGILDTAHPMTATASGASVNFRFTLTNELPFARKAEPVVCGLPLARGFVRAADQLNLLDSEDRPVPVQVLTTSTYSDGTPRWVLLAYHADLPPEGEVVYRLARGHQVES